MLKYIYSSVVAIGLLLAPQRTTFIAQNRSSSGGGGSCTTLPFSDGFTASPGALQSPWSINTGSSITLQSSPAHTVGSGGGFTSGPQVAWPSGCPGWTTSHYSRATLTITDTSHIGLTLQTQDQNNYYYVDGTTGGGYSLVKNIAGTTTFVGSFSGAMINGDTVCLELDSGSSVKLKINGTYQNTLSITGLSGSGGGGLWWGNQGTSGAYWGSFSTGNGVCP